MPSLYHYCRTSTLANIAKEKKIWLSSMTQSNDSAEGKLIREVFINELADSGYPEDLLERINSEIANFEPFVHAFAFCLSKDGDVLSQWRGYASNGEGISIGFSENYLTKLSQTYSASEFINHKSPPFSLCEIFYTAQDHKKQIDSFVKDAINHLFEQLSSIAKDDSLNSDIIKVLKTVAEDRAFNFNISSLLANIATQMFKLKSIYFNEEKEVRLLTDPFAVGRYPYNHRVVGEQIIPYFEYDLLDLKEPMINEVILGPKHQTPKSVIENYLKQIFEYDIPVKQSKLTYR